MIILKSTCKSITGTKRCVSLNLNSGFKLEGKPQLQEKKINVIHERSEIYILVKAKAIFKQRQHVPGIISFDRPLLST